MAVMIPDLPASDTIAGKIEIAVQSEMEAASDTTRAVVPARVQYHPGVAKFWAYVTVSGGTPTLAASHNVTSITDTGAGILTVTIGTDFSSADWCCALSLGGTRLMGDVNALAAGSVQLASRDSVGLADPVTWHVVGFGDQ